MRFTTIIASAAVAAVLGGAGVSVAGAASNSGSPSAAVATTAASTPSSTVAKSGPAAKAGARPRVKALRRRIRRGIGRISADTIGITRPVLREELKAGKTIATIATEHGVQPQAVITALENASNTKIDAALAAHKITDQRAAKLKTRLQTAIPKVVNDWHPKHGA